MKDESPTIVPTFREATRFWWRLGWISFGGPAGQIAILHEELVVRRRWITEERFLHALNFCMLLPGPEAQQLAIFSGWLLHGTLGGIVAGAFFVLPSVLVLYLLSIAYVYGGHLAWIVAIFAGLKPAVLGIILAALFRIGGKVFKGSLGWIGWGIALGAFVALRLGVPFPAVLLAAGFLGFFAAKERGLKSSEKNSTPQPAQTGEWNRCARVLLVCGTLWWAPVLAAWLVGGADSILFRMGIFFSKAAMVTFGGAYAVLPYVAQHAVEQQGWLSAGQMLDGLGFAETTPGPLIMVLQFVGFLGGWNQPGTLSPLAMATLCALLTTWVTFLPCFLWIFLGAPYVERLRQNRALTSAFAAITAAVVGVIASLAYWFGKQLLFGTGHLDLFAASLALASFAAIAWRKWSVLLVVAGGALAGVIGKLCGLY